MPTNNLDLVLKALKNPKWEWLTLKGLSEETNIPQGEILELIRDNPDLVVKSDVKSAKEEDLYASTLQLITKALEDKRWDWRTIDGIAADTRLSQAVVRKTIARNPDLIIRSDVPSVKGDALFTTAARWDKRASIGSKIVGGFRNRRK